MRAEPSSAAGPAWLGPTLAMAGAVAFSGKAIIVKLAYRHGVDPLTLIMLRMLVALPFFVLMALWAARGRPALTGRERLAVAGLGVCGYYLASLLDFAGLQYISAGLERLILYLTPTVVVLLSMLAFGQRAGARQWAAMALGYAGLLLVFGHEHAFGGTQVALGAALVFASVLSYSVYLIGSGRVVRRLGSLRLTGAASLVACALALMSWAAVNPLSRLGQVPAPVWALSLLNGTLCTVLPVWLTMAAIERIGSARTSQLGMVGPVATIAMGVLLLGEPLTGTMLAGSVCVLAGVTLLAGGR